MLVFPIGVVAFSFHCLFIFMYSRARLCYGFVFQTSVFFVSLPTKIETKNKNTHRTKFLKIFLFISISFFSRCLTLNPFGYYFFFGFFRRYSRVCWLENCTVLSYRRVIMITILAERTELQLKFRMLFFLSCTFPLSLLVDFI